MTELDNTRSRRRTSDKFGNTQLTDGHWLILVIVIACVTFLASQNFLRPSDVTALFGGVIGHSATYASMRDSGR